jgi:hypothetical protein
MKHCNNCFRYAFGSPTYCMYCGSSYDKQICSRGHVLGRKARFCPTCGSNDLSTPAPPETAFAWLSRWTLQIVVGSLVGLLLFGFAVSIVLAIDWDALVEPLVRLALMLALLYWLTTMLPASVRRVGKAMGRGAVRMMRAKRSDGGSRRSR